MYRAALRTASRQTLRGLRAQTSRQAPRRLASSASSPADRPRSWKSSALRWGLAVAAVYYYNTSPVFSEDAAEPEEDKEEARSKVAAPSSFAESDLPTVEAVVEKKRQQLEEAKSAREEKEQPQASEDKEADSAAPETKSAASETESDAEPQTAGTEESGQEAAFNPETGEINWDCPCLGGMAHGPCGDEFKTAFSCFVYSTEDPKGMDCIDKFQGMQECFRQYPDVYGAELSDDDEVPQDEVPETPSAPAEEPASDSPKADTPKEETPRNEQPVAAADGVPKKWEDAADASPKEAQKEQPGKKEKDE